MVKKLKRFVFIAVACVAVFAAAAIAWSVIPPKSGKGSADPAVVLANQSSKLGTNYTESYFRHQGLDLHYVEAGHANTDTILFVHGFPQIWYSFNHQIESLSSDYRVIAIDGLGAGRSDAPTEQAPYTLDNMAAHINALLSHLEIEKAHLVGHDWGAALVYGFAQKYPERSKSVIGISAPPQNIMLELLSTSELQQSASGYIDTLKGANPILIKALSGTRRLWENLYVPLLDDGKLSAEQGAMLRTVSDDVKRLNTHINWYRANIPAIDEITAQDYWPARTSKFDVPAMIIWGDDDRVFDPSFIELMKQTNPELGVVKMKGVGHSPQLEEPVKVANSIRGFIESIK